VKRMKVKVTQEICDLVGLIDKKYIDAKEAKISRFSVEWGRWSREMNVEMRKKDGILFKYVFIYWTLRSQLLEVFFKSPSKLVRLGKKRQLRKEIADIKEIILSGNVPEGELTDKELQRILLKSNK